MISKNIIQRGLTLGLGLALGLALTLSLLVGMAVAQGPDDAFIAPAGTDTYWLVLDTAQSVEQTLPELLAALANLKTQARVINYDPTPHSSGPGAVPGVQVAVRSGFEVLLNGLPGVLFVAEVLPPPPPDGIGVQALTVITGFVGEVVNPTNPIASLDVFAYDGVTAQFLATTVGSSGFYTVSVNPAYNQAKLFFDDTSGAHVAEWYNDKSSFNSADPINTTAGGTLQNINALLASANAALTGTVRFTPTNQLVDGASIDVLRASDGSGAGFFITGADGIFTFTNLAAGVYKVLADGGPIAPEFYQDVPFNFGNFLAGVVAATPVTVTSGATQSIAMLVDPTAVITGLVTDTATSLPLAGTFIDLFDPAGNFINSEITDGAGEYQLQGFGSGSYEIEFSAVGFNPELYDNIPADPFGFPPSNLYQATAISATAGQTRTNINAGLTPISGAAITGTVTSFTGTALANVDVDLHLFIPAFGQFVPFATDTTDASGEYVFTNTLNSSYKVAVGFDDDDIIPHAAEWFNNANVINTATTITVTGGISQTGKNVQLALGGCLSGKIVDAESGLPSGGEFYQVLQVENGDEPISFIPNGGSSWTPFFFSSSGPPPLETGEFRACGLPSGDYILDCFSEQITATVTAGSVTGNLVCRVDLTTIYLPIIFK